MTKSDGYYGDRRHRPDWLVYIESKCWRSLAYKDVGVPDYYLPATAMEQMKTGYGVEDRKKEKAPYGTREQLAGAWYGWREGDFWTWRFSDE